MIQSQAARTRTSLRPRAKDALFFLLSMVAMPFFITGWFRLTDALPTFTGFLALPFLIALGAGVGLLFVRRVPRAVAWGVIAGTFVHAGLLAFVLLSFAFGPDEAAGSGEVVKRLSDAVRP